MSSALEEFLVELGFKVDEAGLKRFNDHVAQVTKTVRNMGLAVAGAAAGVAAGVVVMSSAMEKLFYASQRTGVAASRILALRYAAEQVGISAEAAQGALAGFAQTLRLNPGAGGLLDSLGVVQGSAEERLKAFVRKTQDMAPYVASAYAGIFGISPEQLQAMQLGFKEAESAEQDYLARLKLFGIDSGQAARAGRDFNNVIRRGASDLEMMWIVIQSKLAPVLTPLIEKFEKWAETHADDYARAIATAVEKLAEWLGRIDWDDVFRSIDEFGRKADQAAQSVGGWKNVLIGLIALQFAPLIASLVALGAAMTTIAGAGARITGLAMPGWFLRLAGAGATTALYSRGLNEGEDETLARLKREKGWVDRPSDAPVGAPRGIRNNNPGNIRAGAFATAQGAVGADDKGFATFPDMATGRQATAALLQSYASRGFDTVRKIVSRWAPSSENNTDAYISAIASKLGLSADAKVPSGAFGELANSIFAHENGARWGQMMDTKLGATSSGSSPVTIHQHNEYNVNGSRDPEGTARAVERGQSRNVDDLARTLAGASY